MNGLVTDSLKNGGGLLGPDIFASAPTPSIYDQIPLKGILRYLGICCKDRENSAYLRCFADKIPPFTSFHHHFTSIFYTICYISFQHCQIPSHSRHFSTISSRTVREPFENLRDSQPGARDNFVNTPNSLNQPFSASFVFRRFSKKRLRRN